jgi:hypothetical protein
MAPGSGMEARWKRKRPGCDPSPAVHASGYPDISADIAIRSGLAARRAHLSRRRSRVRVPLGVCRSCWRGGVVEALSAGQSAGTGSRRLWSSDGRRLAVVHRGWVELIGADGGRSRQLTRGGAPAWAPDGKELAFVGDQDRLFVIGVRGGRPRPVGDVCARSVDWQPVLRTRPSACESPAGSSVAAASAGATITIDPAPTGQSPPLSGSPLQRSWMPGIRWSRAAAREHA